MDWEREVDIRLSRGEKKALEEQFGPWLRTYRNVNTNLVHWAATPGLTTQGVISELQAFSRIVDAALKVGLILHDAAIVLRNEGWRQGERSEENRGFDLVDAIGRSCELHHTGPHLRIAAIEALCATIQELWGQPTTLTDWNDAPRRTKREVLHALSTCADQMECY